MDTMTSLTLTLSLKGREEKRTCTSTLSELSYSKPRPLKATGRSPLHAPLDRLYEFWHLAPVSREKLMNFVVSESFGSVSSSIPT